MILGNNMPTADIYLYPCLNVANAIGFYPALDDEIKDTLQRIEDGTYEYVGEIRPKFKFWEVYGGGL
jgi:hypothetical protein